MGWLNDNLNNFGNLRNLFVSASAAIHSLRRFTGFPKNTEALLNET